MKKDLAYSDNIRDIFDLINYDIFDGELDQPCFAINYDPSMMGFHTVWDGRHIISLMAEMGYTVSIAVLAHEMIHQYQFDNGLPRLHNEKSLFKYFARKIEKTYNLKRGTI